MKLRLLLASFFLAFVAASLVRAGADDTPLDKEMSTMNKAFRQLKKQAGDAAQNAASLELVSRLKKGAEASAELIPAKAAAMTEKERADFVADYKEKMKQFVVALGRLEAAFKAGDNAAATKLVAELNSLERSGHKEFRKPKDE